MDHCLEELSLVQIELSFAKQGAKDSFSIQSRRGLTKVLYKVMQT